MYSSVSGPGIYVPPSRCLSRAEVAAYESLEHGVPSIRHYATVQWMRNVTWFRILPIPEIRWWFYNELRCDEREKVRANIPIVVITDAIRNVGDIFVLFIRAHFT